jgi:uncharacterized protein YciI
MYYTLLYDVVDNFIERRAPLREAHLKLVQESHQRGELWLAGALVDPVDGAALACLKSRTCCERVKFHATSFASVHHDSISRSSRSKAPRSAEWSRGISGARRATPGRKIRACTRVTNSARRSPSGVTW